MAKAGELVRIRRGAYAAAVASDPEGRHRQLIAATLPRLADDACVSHQSAAVMHGLPAWADQLGRVHVIRPRRGGGRRGSLVHVHPAPLPESEVVSIGGLRVTCLSRTIADCARSMSYERAVGLGDAALRQGLDRQQLLAAIDQVRGAPGSPSARRVAGFVDGRSESMGESLSRVVLQRLRIPAPTLQLPVLDRSGLVMARADFGWEELRTLGEFDGRIKYGRLLPPGDTAGDVIYREKAREDKLRDLGWEVVRWIWSDLRTPDVIADRLQRAFARGRRR